MSKGPGRVQRAALDLLADHEGRYGLTVREIAEAVLGERYNEINYRAVARALRSLRDRGLVVTPGTDAWGRRRYRLP